MWCSCIVLTFSYIHLSTLMGTIDIFLGNERARVNHYITSPTTSLASLSENEERAQNIYSIAWHILAERPCLPFSPGVLCSHCLTEWLIWLNFTLQTFQVHSLFPHSLSEKHGHCCGLLLYENMRHTDVHYKIKSFVFNIHLHQLFKSSWRSEYFWFTSLP